MIHYRRALAALLAQPRPLDVQSVPLAGAGGRVLAADVHSPMHLPAFDNAAMDGFALAARGGVLPHDAVYDVQASQAAGDGQTTASPHAAWEIMTGARMPAGLDCVIPVERVEVLTVDPRGHPSRIRLLGEVKDGDNVRTTGSDITLGERITKAGRSIDPAFMMLLAAIGSTHVRVCRRPRVAIICTGKELQPDPALALGSGRIYNSNGPYLAAALPAMGATIVHEATVDDEGHAFHQAMHAALAQDADLILTTGALSAGRHDFIPAALDTLGATTIFRKAAIRPGKPVTAAHMEGGAVVLALPGNPMAVAVGLRFFAAPLLRSWQGQPASRPLRARLDTPMPAQQGFCQFIQANVRHNSDGQLRVLPVMGQKAYRIRPLLDANAWMVLDETALGRTGEVVEVHSLDADGRWDLLP